MYDSHEYATQEHAQNWKWRLVSRSAVSAIERRNVASADLVITVSRGIAEALQADYGLPAAPVVVRNMPSYRPTPLRPPNGRRQILFHGLIRPERGLESLIDAVPALTFAGDVVVRGYGLSAYLDSLKARARERGVGDRVVFAPAVGPDHLIERAAEADLGVLLLPGITRHYEFALPNKLFEYLMAGLPVLASPRREIRTLLDEIGAGLFAEPDPGSVAAALNALTEDALIGMRRAALAAARALNWDAEKRLLVGAVEEAHRRRPGRRAG